MKKIYFIIIMLPLFIQSCSTNKNKIIGTWTISNLNVNGERYDGVAGTKIKTIQFLKNGFFILTATEKVPEMNIQQIEPENKIIKLGGYTRNQTYNGRWELTGFSKIEIHFIGHPYLNFLGLQKGTYKFHDNLLEIDIKGSTDFCSIKLHK